jgi:23S rRNA pseudouridine1911/1915/1917 synthase
MASSFLQLGQAAPLHILLDERAFLVVNKPAGQLVHGYTKGLPQTLNDQIKDHIRQESGKTGNVFLGSPHRIDRPVSGIVLFAKTSKAAGRFGLQFESRSVEKSYLAVVEGVIKEDRGTMVDRLPEVRDDRSQAEAVESDPIDQDCHLDFAVLARHENTSLIRIELGTGRRHQIRRQLAIRGHAIVGDSQYGATTFIPKTSEIDARFRPIALHAFELAFDHPKEMHRITTRAPLPEYWTTLGFELSKLL